MLDGFPRTAAQAAALEKMNNGKADAVILLNVDDDKLVDRVVGRRRDPETGKIYHMVTNPPETKEIAARLEQRADDTEETVKVRLGLFHENVGEVLSVYEGTWVEPTEDTLMMTTDDEGWTSGYETTGNLTEGEQSEVEVEGVGKMVETLALGPEVGKGGEEKKEEPQVVVDSGEVVIEVEVEVDGDDVTEGESEYGSPLKEGGGESFEDVEEKKEEEEVVLASRIFKIDGNSAPAEIASLVYETLRDVTHWDGIPPAEEVELRQAATKIQGVFRTREAKKKAEHLKAGDGVFEVGGAHKSCTVNGLPILAKFLIEKGADVNISDDNGNFPLHWALSGASVEFEVRSGEERRGAARSERRGFARGAKRRRWWQASS